jgi:hypothetical protein
MIVYQTDLDGIYVGTTVAQEDPKNPGTYLLPRGCVLEAPPVAGPHQVAVYKNEAWSLVADYRGVTYWLADGTSTTVTTVGVTPPEGALGAAPTVELTDEEVRAQLVKGVEAFVDNYASGWGYNSVYTAATYLTSSVAKFKAEAKALVQWRDLVWYFIEDFDEKVRTGKKPAPASLEALIVMLPTPPDRPVV